MDPHIRPNIINSVDNIPAVIDWKGFTHFGAFITLYVSKYPLLKPKNAFPNNLKNCLFVMTDSRHDLVIKWQNTWIGINSKRNPFISHSFDDKCLVVIWEFVSQQPIIELILNNRWLVIGVNNLFGMNVKESQTGCILTSSEG